MMDGKGQIRYANGDSYIGHFKANKMNGSGILTKANKNNLQFKGIWQNGQLKQKLEDSVQTIFKNMAI